MSISYDDNERLRLQGSLLEFTRVMYFLRHGRPFITDTKCISRESHYIVVMRELVKLTRLENKNLIINIPPGMGKSTCVIFWICWCFSIYPDCKFIYLSYSAELAEGHTAEIKAIMSMPIYKKIFGVYIDPTSSAKGDFRVLNDRGFGSGRCVARGSMGAVTGIDAGNQSAKDEFGNPRFSGLCVMDDMHKMSEVSSDLKRQTVIDNYNGTIKNRRRGIDVGTLIIGQRGHEDDISNFLLEGKDGMEWRSVILQGLDGAENALAPTIRSKAELLKEREVNPYNFYAQEQQQPTPAGGSLFRGEWFKKIDYTPDIIQSIVVCDSAESESAYADSTVFSFFGLYKIKFNGVEIPNLYGLHWIDCRELKIEPKDLEREFLDFYVQCQRFKVPPSVAAIEKHSSGVGLVSMLKNVPGLRIIPIEHHAGSGSKSTRFIECQRFVAEGQISLPIDGKHTDMCIKHMSKITANNTHRWDDIADTLEMAIRMVFIDKLFLMRQNIPDYDNLAADFGRKSQPHRLTAGR